MLSLVWSTQSNSSSAMRQRMLPATQKILLLPTKQSWQPYASIKLTQFVMNSLINAKQSMNHYQKYFPSERQEHMTTDMLHLAWPVQWWVKRGDRSVLSVLKCLLVTAWSQKKKTFGDKLRNAQLPSYKVAYCKNHRRVEELILPCIMDLVLTMFDSTTFNKVMVIPLSNNTGPLWYIKGHWGAAWG